MPPKSSNVVAVEHRVATDQRHQNNGHRGGVLWFTGLPGSGKTTLAIALEQRLFEEGYQTYVLDGDNIRHGLSSDLGFSHEDRTENIRRIGEIAALFADAGLIVISAFISPYRADRRIARAAAKESFYEVYLNAPVEVCESRDPKGHYQRARKGEIKDFTGVSAPYEAPENPEFVVDTENRSLEDCLADVVDFVDRNFSLQD